MKLIFSIERGHDGPARTGELSLDEMRISTPSLIGPKNEAMRFWYSTYERDTISTEAPYLISLGSTMMWNSPDLSKLSDNSLLLLPSSPGIDELHDASEFDLRFQLEILNELNKELDSSRFAVRVPNVKYTHNIGPILRRFSETGVLSAAISFDSLAGQRDLDSLFMRTHLPRNWLIIALGRITPSMIPLLHYAGIDIIDIGYAWTASTKQIRLWPYEQEEIDPDIVPRFCRCSACLNSDKLGAEILLSHNIRIYREILSESVYNASQGRLRNLVESYTHASPALAGLLRRVNRELYEFLEEFTPTSGQSVQPLIGPESYHAPMIRRFRERLVERFTPPPQKCIVLLLPCSARKPYSDSKSHRRYISTIESALGPQRSLVAETILTSPLGVIPRELERMYPASHYDIPVTGSWDTEEVSIGADALVAHLAKFSEESVVIAHVHGGYLDIVRACEDRIQQSIIYTLEEDTPSSRRGLQNLRETLVEMKDILDLKGSRSTLSLDTLRATADFQFGSGTGNFLIPDGAKLTGKLYRMVIARDADVQTCAFVSSSGLLSLTMDGGRRITPLERYLVKFLGEEIKGGSLFAVGVSEADEIIRPGDEVIVMNKSNELVAVGRSEMSGPEMCEFSRGRAVTIRHKGAD